jgi:hypothetical protein
MRFLQSLLISLNVHLWGVVLAAAAWAATASTPPEPAPMEISFLRLPPASREGQAGMRPEVEIPRLSETAKRSIPNVSAKTRPAAETLVSIAPGARAAREKVRRGPRVEYRVKIATEGTLARAGHAVTGMRPALAGWAPPVREPDIDEEVSDRRIRVVASDTSDSDELEWGGDTRPLIEIIQARIDRMTPLMHRTAKRCRYESGLVRVKFLLDSRGYPCGHRIIRSSGSACLDAEVDTVLHMAEPYPYVAGWIPVTVKFTL